MTYKLSKQIYYIKIYLKLIKILFNKLWKKKDIIILLKGCLKIY